MTSSACSRLSRMLLSRWLCAPPSVPSVSFSADATSLVATFAYSPPGPYNAGDVIELQLHPASPEVVAALGPLACWVTFHEAPFAQQRRATLKDMQPGRAFGARVRARNAAGAEGAWSEEQLVTTLALPVRCGGVGPGYTWDQTPEGVEARVAVPAGTAARDVALTVLPTRLLLRLRGAVLLEGPLGGDVVAADAGDWEWELAAGGGGEVRGGGGAGGGGGGGDDGCGGAPAAAAGSVLVLSLAKRPPFDYDPLHQWRCLVDAPGHPKIDVAQLEWLRTDRPWRPPRDAATLDEVALALPGNTVRATPTHEDRPEAGVREQLRGWGDGWGRPSATGAAAAQRTPP